MMGGFASVFRGALAGLNEAAGNPGVAQNLEAQNAAAQQAKHQQLQMQVMPHGVAIKGIQERIKSLDTKDPHYDDMKSALTAEMARHISGINDLLYPEKDPNPKGNFFQRDFMDKLHLTSLKNRQSRYDEIKKTRDAQQQKRQGQSQESAEALAEGQVPPANPFQQRESQLSGVGFTPEQTQKSLETMAGITPKLTGDGIPYKGTDGKWYQNFKDASGQITPRDKIGRASCRERV